MIPLIKTDMSIGKSIIQISPIKSGEKNKPDQPDNVEDIIADYGFKKLFLVEDNVGGFIPAYKAAKALDCSLVFGWRISICEEATKKEKQSSSKVIVFVRSEAGWKTLVKLATYGQVDGYFEEARIDWKKLQELWSDELVLAIPHYDGFVVNNLTRKTSTIPDFGKIRPFMFLEDCDMFFDGIVRDKTLEYAAAFGLKTVEVKTCYYKNRADLTYFQARKLMDMIPRQLVGVGGTIRHHPVRGRARRCRTEGRIMCRLGKVQALGYPRSPRHRRGSLPWSRQQSVSTPDDSPSRGSASAGTLLCTDACAVPRSGRGCSGNAPEHE